MKKQEIIEILKEELSIDGNRGAHQYWIVGIEKAADRLEQQPEVSATECLNKLNRLDTILNKYGGNLSMSKKDLALWNIWYSRGERLKLKIIQSHHPQTISEERVEGMAKEYEKSWGNSWKDEHEWVQYYRNEDFIEGIKAALKELTKTKE